MYIYVIYIYIRPSENQKVAGKLKFWRASGCSHFEQGPKGRYYFCRSVRGEARRAEAAGDGVQGKGCPLLLGKKIFDFWTSLGAFLDHFLTIFSLFFELFFPTYSVSYFPCCLSPLTIFCKIYTPAFLCRWWPPSTFLLPKFLKVYLKLLHFRPFSIRFWPLSIHLSWPLSLHFNDLPIIWKQ